jgi:hypothetical protein
MWNGHFGSFNSVEWTSFHRFLTLFLFFPRHRLPDDFKTAIVAVPREIIDRKILAELATVAFSRNGVDIILGQNFQNRFVYHGILLEST